MGKSFYRRREGAACRKCTISSDCRLEIGHRGSDQHLLVWFACVRAKSLQSCPTLCNPRESNLLGSSVHDLRIVTLQVQGQFVPISLMTVLMIVATYVMTAA